MAAQLRDASSLDELRRRRDPVLAQEIPQPRLVRADPLPAEVHRLPGDFSGLDPAADAVAGVEDHDLAARGGKRPGGHQPGEARADDDDVGRARALDRPAQAGAGGRRRSVAAAPAPSSRSARGG